MGLGRQPEQGGQGEVVQRTHRAVDKEEASELPRVARRDPRGVPGERLEGDQADYQGRSEIFQIRVQRKGKVEAFSILSILIHISDFPCSASGNSKTI